MNHLYPKGRQAFIVGSVDVAVDTFRVVLTDATYVQSDADQFLTAIATPVATSAPLTGLSSTGGTLSASSIVVPAVATGKTLRGLAVYKDTGSAATSPLLAWVDTNADGGPIDYPTTGGSITVAWAGGVVFTL